MNHLSGDAVSVRHAVVMLLLESIGVATDQWFGATADPHTPFASMAAVPLFLALAIVGAVPLFFSMRHLDVDRAR